MIVPCHPGDKPEHLTLYYNDKARHKPKSPSWLRGILTSTLQRILNFTYHFVIFWCCGPCRSGEFTSHEFFFQANSINRRFIVAYTPQQNRTVPPIGQSHTLIEICYLVMDRIWITHMTITNTYTSLHSPTNRTVARIGQSWIELEVCYLVNNEIEEWKKEGLK